MYLLEEHEGLNLSSVLYRGHNQIVRHQSAITYLPEPDAAPVALAYSDHCASYLSTCD